MEAEAPRYENLDVLDWTAVRQKIPAVCQTFAVAIGAILVVEGLVAIYSPEKGAISTGLPLPLPSKRKSNPFEGEDEDDDDDEEDPEDDEDREDSGPAASAASAQHWVVLAHTRSLSFGLVVLMLAYLRRWDLVGATLLCGVPVGVVDSVVVKKHGLQEKFRGHVVGSLIMAISGFVLVRAQEAAT